MPKVPTLLFTYLTEALIVFFYLKHIYSPRKNNRISFIFTLIFYSFLMFIYNFTFSNDLLNIVLVLITNFIIIFLLFNSSFKSAIFHSVALGILQLISEFLTIYFTAFVFNTSPQQVISDSYLLLSAISRLFYFLFSNILAKFSVKEDKVENGKWWILSIMPISSIFFIFVIVILTKQMALSHEKQFIINLSILLLMISNIIIYDVYEQAEKSNKKLIELEITNQKDKIDLQYLNLLEKKNEEMQIMAHDYKNHIATIASMYDSPEIKEYLNSMLGEISQFNQIAKTKNKLLDVILSKYANICKEKAIKFETDIMAENLDFISGQDISSLFNNSLDNAVEAAEHSKERFVKLEISNSINFYHKIIIENSCDNEPQSKNGTLVTTKKNKRTHGFGTKSILKTITKYGGEFQWEYKQSSKTFKLIILIPPKQA